MKNLAKDVCVTLAYSGFRKILIIDGHGGNPPALMQVTKEVTEETGAACVYLMAGVGIPPEVRKKVLSTPSCHVDEGETSMNMALRNRVLMDRALRRYSKGSDLVSPRQISKVVRYFRITLVRGRFEKGDKRDRCYGSANKGVYRDWKSST